MIDVQGHRGARGHLPENTLPGFAFALEMGVTTLELDVGVTKDDRVIVSYDVHTPRRGRIAGRVTHWPQLGPRSLQARDPVPQP